jgi:lipopolysaccharide transport system ATP-binding protein
MGNVAIRVDRIGKQYLLGSSRPRYETVRDAFVNLFRRRPKEETFWALRDVSFEVPKGEVLGIIGRNGAGKSTLLKILSSITDPTEGEAKIYGRMGALLEVGTGFHPELTGRENVYLNGAILGMPRGDIDRRFDEIVAFAEIERFLDTPAKHYSSGMYMRLAFSVAAHLEPDILVVDEVLAVGDANFQKKCMGKMEQVGREGRTVLFVSHSMPTVLRLCRRAMLLEHGKHAQSGTPHDVVAAYLRTGSGASGERVWPDRATAPGDQVARLHAVRARDEEGRVVDSIPIDKPVCIEIDYWHSGGTSRPAANFHLYNDEGVCLFASSDFVSERWKQGPRPAGLLRSTCHIPGNFLAEGRVIVRYAAVTSFNPTLVHAIEQDPISFQVVDRTDGEGARGPYANEWPGAVRPLLTWTLEDEVTS